MSIGLRVDPVGPEADAEKNTIIGRRFRFEEKWIHNQECGGIIEERWKRVIGYSPRYVHAIKLY